MKLVLLPYAPIMNILTWGNWERNHNSNANEIIEKSHASSQLAKVCTMFNEISSVHHKFSGQEKIQEIEKGS